MRHALVGSPSKIVRHCTTLCITSCTSGVVSEFPHLSQLVDRGWCGGGGPMSDERPPSTWQGCRHGNRSVFRYSVSALGARHCASAKLGPNRVQDDLYHGRFEIERRG